MTHYEELGVPPDAGSGEIHRAYRQLTRLLHPDRQADPALRKAAERQMRRLNAVYAVLSNEEARSRYDAGIAAPVEAPRQPWAIRWIAAAIAATALACVWLWPAGRPVSRVTSEAAAQSQPRQPAPVQPRRAIRSRREQPVRLPDPPPAPRLPLPPPPALDPMPALAVIAAETPHVAAAPAPPGMTGTWFYAGANRGADGLYAPEYIELVLWDRQGSLRGRYRARYRVGDRAISPVVAFELSGAPAGPDGAVAWRGPAGARGEVRLRLLAADRLEVNWSADELGAELGLAAGRAVLSRAP